MPILTTATPSAQPHEFDLRRQLRQRLLALPYRAFLQVVIDLLRRQGYSLVRPAGRNQLKGRNRGGGWDVEAEFPAGAIGTLRAIVQVKQFASLVVHQRQVDELHGSCLRAGAQHALLVTLSTFSPVAQQAAEAASQIVPVRLIDGERLLDILMEQELAITADEDGTWCLNELYFEVLQELFENSAVTTKPQAGAHKRIGRAHSEPSVTVIVRLASPKKFSNKADRT